MNVDAAIRDAERIERERENGPTGARMYFLIRSNVEFEGWMTDGVFAWKEAKEQIAAMLRTQLIAKHEGHSFDFKVFGLLEGAAAPKALIDEIAEGEFRLRLPVSQALCLAVEIPSVDLDY